jgi:hypothetical protein
MAFCIPVKQTAAFLKALKDGTITPEKMSAMTSDERRTLFEGIVGKENAKDVNALLESKLLLKDQNRGMVTWAKKVAGLSDVQKADLVSKVSKLDRLLDVKDKDAFLSDLAEKKLGVCVTADEMGKILDLSKKAQDLKGVNPKMSGVSDEYLKAREDLKGYIDSRKPVSAWKSITRNVFTIFRNNLLMNPATPVKTTINQAVNSAMDLVTRRIGFLSARGFNSELASKANSEAWETYRKTGLNTASMENMDDAGSLGEKNRFATTTGKDSSGRVVNAVETATRKVAQVTNKISIDWEHNISYTKFYQKAFFDGANIISSTIAKGEKLTGTEAKSRAAAIFSDASRIEPKTPEGALVRMEAQKQAARVTSTNSTLMSKFSMAMKDALNKTIPKLGDAIIPIAKIPANVIWNGIENSGVGIPLGFKDIWQGRKKLQSDDLATKHEGLAQLSFGIQRVGRIIGVMSAAALFSSQLTKDDFRQDKWGSNFVKIGKVWINMEYISGISPALAGFMKVRQKRVEGQGAANTVSQYISGAASGLKSAPGIDEASTLVNDLTNPNYAKGIAKYASNFFSSRGTPRFVQNLMQNRPIDRLFWGSTGIETPKQVEEDKQKQKENAQKNKPKQTAPPDA